MISSTSIFPLFGVPKNSLGLLSFRTISASVKGLYEGNDLIRSLEENKNFNGAENFSDTVAKRRDSGFSEGNLIPDSPFLQGKEQVINHPQQGMPAKHIEKAAEFAQANNLVIAFRPVEVWAKNLLAKGGISENGELSAQEDYPTKGIHIKAKSSNWGPMAGFIPVLKKFTKFSVIKDVALDTLADQEQEGVAALLKDQTVAKVPLKLTVERLHELISNNLIEILNKSYGGVENIKLKNNFIVYSSDPNNRNIYFRVNKSASEDGYIFFDEYENIVEILADIKTKKPIISDYDLLLVAPSIEEMDDQDNMMRVLEPEQSNRTSHYYSQMHPDFGNTTQRIIKKVIPGINKALKGESKAAVVHHGADEGNPNANPTLNYPATVFLPRPMAGLEPVLMVRNHKELAQLLKIIADANYCFKVNPLWEEPALGEDALDQQAQFAPLKLKQIRREAFISAKKELENFFNKKLWLQQIAQQKISWLILAKKPLPNHKGYVISLFCLLGSSVLSANACQALGVRQRVPNKFAFPYQFPVPMHQFHLVD